MPQYPSMRIVRATKAQVKRITIASFDLDDELERALVEMEGAIDRNDRDEFELPHRRFHQLLVSHVQQGARTRMAIDADSSERVRRFLMQDDRHSLSKADAEHRAIVEACRARDGAQASYLLASHLARSAFYVTAQLEPTYDTILTRTALRMVLGEDSAQARG